MRFFVNKKSGFKTFDKLLIVNDNSGNIFYYKENNGNEINFNLPIGEYSTNNKIFHNKIVDYKKYRLPRGKRLKRVPNKMNYLFENNPNKASIDTSTNTVYLDHSFKYSPKVKIEFVLGHEEGHYFYFGNGEISEQLCDFYSYNKLIDLGYNPSQIFYAQKFTLGDSKPSQCRKKLLFNHIKNNEK